MRKTVELLRPCLRRGKGPTLRLELRLAGGGGLGALLYRGSRGRRRTRHRLRDGRTHAADIVVVQAGKRRCGLDALRLRDTQHIARGDLEGLGKFEDSHGLMT